MPLTAERVHVIFRECLYREGEPTDDHVPVGGITINVGFHPARLASYAKDVRELLGELPSQFHEKTGGGWSFLQACVDKDGVQWGEHLDMQKLFLLGLGLGQVTECLPREMWTVLPGGMPYYQVKA